jgi:alcohol dehydrogenase class IV
LEKYSRVAAFFGETTDRLPTAETSKKAIEAIKKLTADLKLPTRMRDLGVNKNQIPHLVDLLFTVMIRNVGNNPRPVSREDAAKIFEAAW